MPGTTLPALSTSQLTGIPTEAQWATVLSMCEALVKSGLLPQTVKTPQAAAAIVLKGSELGISPMQSFAHITVISGKPSCSAELHLALLARGGVSWEWLKDGTGGEAAIAFHRPGFPKPIIGSYSLTEAKQAGLMNNPTWSKYSKNMLRARAITNGARMVAPDLLAGMSYTPEELGAEVDEDGNVVNLGGPDRSRPASTPSPSGMSQADNAVEAEFTEGADPTAEQAPEKPPIIPPTEDDGSFLFTPPSEPGADDADAERKALIRAIEKLEEEKGMPRAHIVNARKKYAGGTADFSNATLDQLCAYLEKMEKYAGPTAA